MICDKCGIDFNETGVQKCVHEKVNEIYGKNICRYCCMKCKHNIFVEGGQECELLRESKRKQAYAIEKSKSEKRMRRKSPEINSNADVACIMPPERLDGV